MSISKYTYIRTCCMAVVTNIKAIEVYSLLGPSLLHIKL